jgi:hypothetical protein
MQQQLDSTAAALKARREELRSVKHSLQQREAKASALEAALSAREAAVSSAGDGLAEALQALEQQRAQCDAREQESAAQAAAAEAATAAVRDECASLRTAAAELQSELDSVRAALQAELAAAVAKQVGRVCIVYVATMTQYLNVCWSGCRMDVSEPNVTPVCRDACYKASKKLWLRVHDCFIWSTMNYCSATSITVLPLVCHVCQATYCYCYYTTTLVMYTITGARGSCCTAKGSSAHN